MQALTTSEISQVIFLASAAYPESTPDDSTELQIGFTPTQLQLLNYIESLGLEKQHELCALMWLGRGAGGEQASDWDGLVAEAKTQDTEHLGSYLVEKSPLAEYLRDGANKLEIFVDG